MDGMRITKRLVDGLKPAANEYFVWDRKLLGFGVRIQPSGVMSYVAKYRAGSGRRAPTRRVTLGRVGKITPDEAYKLAKRSATHGLDPAAVKAADRQAPTLGEVANLFLADHVESKRKAATASHYRDIFGKDRGARTRHPASCEGNHRRPRPAACADEGSSLSGKPHARGGLKPLHVRRQAETLAVRPQSGARH
jgi:hypothetical protein